MNKLTKVSELRKGDTFYHPLVKYELRIDDQEFIENGQALVYESYMQCPVTGEHIVFRHRSARDDSKDYLDYSKLNWNADGTPFYSLDDYVWVTSS